MMCLFLPHYYLDRKCLLRHFALLIVVVWKNKMTLLFFQWKRIWIDANRRRQSVRLVL